MTANQPQPEETFTFQAEVARLLDLMVHSVYSEREVFLRELISNAADALDKLRYEALTDASLIAEDEPLAITIALDKETRRLVIEDNGIGMSRQELIDNLGTIARSGTKAFVEQVKSAADKQTAAPDLIGQFGVGFYSAFMIADKVDVVSTRAGTSESWRWTSDGKGAFEIDAVEPAAPRGTRIELHVKEDADEFLDDNEIRRIVHTYSDHISFPIYLAGAPAESDEDKDKENDDNEIEDARQQLNEANALWTRPKSEITPEQYKEFYHHTGGMYDEPALTVHYTAEGRQLFTALLFVPSVPPFDLYDPQRSGHIRLYVKRVFITDEAQLLPSYLRFVRGVVDSEDIPLNLSREMLQNNPLLASIRKAVANKLLSELAKYADKEPEKYIPLWENFGAVIKEGLYEDAERRDTLYKLTRFKTTKTEAPDAKAPETTADGDDAEDSATASAKAAAWRTLDAYVADMPEKQDAIYYLTGDNLDQLKASPQLEGFLARGIEVLLLTDPVDSFWVTTAAGYQSKPLRSITQGSADLDAIPLKDEADSDEEKPDAAVAQSLVEKLKTVLGEEVSDVKTSSRLVGSPACLIAPMFAPDRQMEKLLARQTGGGDKGLKPILEINAGHAIAKALGKSLEENKEDAFSDLAFILLDEARILEGGAPADPAKFTERLNRLILGT